MSSVQIIGLDGFISGLAVAKDSLKPAVEAAAMNVALEVRRLAQGKVPRRGGDLQRSIVADPIEFGAMTSVQEVYGLYVEEGTGLYDPQGAHLIYPKTAQAMVWEDGGVTYGARYTRGMEAQPFFWPSVKEADPTLQREMGKAVDGVLKEAVSA